MLRCMFLTVTLAMAVCFSSVSSFAGDKKETEADRKMSADARAIADVAAAYRLVEFGRHNKAPETLIAAARVIGTTQCAKGTLTPMCKVGNPLEFDEVKEAMALLDEAAKMGRNSPPILALVKQTREILVEKGRSPFGNAKVYSSFFRGDGKESMDKYYVDLRGEEVTCISVFGNGPAGLNIDVELWNDSTGKLVAADHSTGPNAFIRVYIPTAGKHRIHVINQTPKIRCDSYTLRAY